MPTEAPTEAATLAATEAPTEAVTAAPTAVPAATPLFGELNVDTSIDAGEQLLAAFDRQVEVNGILTDPDLGMDPAKIRTALLQAGPGVVEVRARLLAALAAMDGDAAALVDAAQELNAALLIAPLILAGPDDEVPLRHEELVYRGGSALAAINLALSHLGLGLGPSVPESGQQLTTDMLTAAEGYQAEVMGSGLNFLSAIAGADDGTVYVGEAGFAYGNIRTPARVLQVGDDGTTEVVAEGFEGPLAGIAVHEDSLFVSHRGTITRVDLASGEKTDIITGLPSQGDHFNENIDVSPNGMLYFTQGVATNSGIVGPDNYFFGWLPMNPEFTEIPCPDLTLSGVSYESGNILTPNDPRDIATTGPYLPYGTIAEPGQVVTAQVPCTGAVLRANLDGTGLEVYADGFRNPYGLTFHPDGRLFVTENGPDARGSRPIESPDNFYEVTQGGWYGFPDFYGGTLVTDPAFAVPGRPAPQALLQDPPELAGQPMAQLAAHSASNGFDFASGTAFGPAGQAFIAQFGDLTPPTGGGVVAYAGQQVVMVTANGEVQPFLTNPPTGDDRPLLRPIDAKFSADGTALSVVHFGQMTAVPGGVAPVPGTGALIRITPASAAAAPEASTVTVGLVDGTINMPVSLPAEPTTFNVTNNGTSEHSLAVEGQGIEEAIEPHLQPSASGTLQVDLQPGTYEFYCPVPGHRERGMTLDVTVTEGGG